MKKDNLHWPVEGITVLSLFDGISCGRVALERAEISVKNYYASEIESSAIKITKKNHPDTIEIGDVSKVSYSDGVLYTEKSEYDVGRIHLLIGGSPCTDFSSIGYANGMKSGTEEICSLKQYLNLKNKGVSFNGQSYLFWEFIRLLHEVKPDFFLLENVVMSKKWQKIIDTAIGAKPIRINSTLMSAQNRPRLYWTNIPEVKIPEDKNITLADIIDGDASDEDVSHCKTIQKAFSKLVERYGYLPEKFNSYNIKEIENKACALSRGSMVTSSCATLIFKKTEKGVHEVENGLMDSIYPTKLQTGKYNLRRLSIKEMERLQTLPDDYTDVSGVGIQKRSAAIGNGWTVDVIAHILSNIKKEY